MVNLCEWVNGGQHLFFFCAYTSAGCCCSFFFFFFFFLFVAVGRVLILVAVVKIRNSHWLQQYFNWGATKYTCSPSFAMYNIPSVVPVVVLSLSVPTCMTNQVRRVWVGETNKSMTSRCALHIIICKRMWLCIGLSLHYFSKVGCWVGYNIFASDVYCMLLFCKPMLCVSGLLAYDTYQKSVVGWFSSHAHCILLFASLRDGVSGLAAIFLKSRLLGGFITSSHPICILYYYLQAYVIVYRA